MTAPDDDAPEVVVLEPPPPPQPTLLDRAHLLLEPVRGDMPLTREFIAPRLDAAWAGGSCGEVVAWQAAEMLDATLRGVSQVYLLSNPITGLLMLLGLCLSSDPMRAVFAVAGSFAGMLGGYAVFDGRHLVVAAGVHGYGGVLCAAAVNTFIEDPNRWHVFVAAVVLAFASGFLSKGISEWSAAHGTPAFTLNFNVLCLGFLVATRADKVGGMQFPLPSAVCPTATMSDGMLWLEGFVVGAGQLILCDTLAGSIAVVAGLCWCDIYAGAASIVGSTIGGATALLVAGAGQASNVNWNCVVKGFRLGLAGYNSTATAVNGVLFTYVRGPWLWRFGLLVMGSIVTEFADIMLAASLTVPPLTMPFVLVSWIMVLSQRTDAPLLEEQTVMTNEQARRRRRLQRALTLLTMSTDFAELRMCYQQWRRFAAESRRAAYVEYLGNGTEKRLLRRYFCTWRRTVDPEPIPSTPLDSQLSPGEGQSPEGRPLVRSPTGVDEHEQRQP